MATSIFSGRSRHGRHTARSSRSKATIRRPATKTKPREEAEGAVSAAKPEKPDLEDLRRRRLLYLSVSPEARRRVSAGVIPRAASQKGTQSHDGKRGSEHGRRKRKHKSSSNRAGRDVVGRSERSRTEDYVYAIDSPSDVVGEDEQAHRSTPHSQQSKKNVTSRSRRASLPTVVESEITPDDSISQVGISQDARQTSSGPGARSSGKRSSRLPPISEKNDDSKTVTTASRRSSKQPQPSSLLGLLRRNTAPAVTPPRLVECLTCAADDVPRAKSAKLDCGHRMCHSCLKRIFEMSVKDPAHMPPKCCTTDRIPLQHVEKIFDLKFKILWNRKYQEFDTKNRIYCTASKCGEWIKPTHMHTSQGRKYAQCPRCQTKVCTLCNAKFHRSKDCPNDPEIAKLVEQAKEKGWQSCFNCHAMVELKEGCNHMTCRCLAEFCMVCGLKWKTCDCPWFNYTRLPDPDRLVNWGVPEPMQAIYRRAFGAPDQQPPVAEGRIPIPVPAVPRPNRAGPLTYTEEANQRQRQERLDADLARRLQLASLLEPEDEPQGNPRRRRRDAETWGLGNAAGHFMNDNFVQNAADVVMNAFGDAALGQRGERSSARRRRPPREPPQEDTDPGLVHNFLGDESVFGRGPRTPP